MPCLYHPHHPSPSPQYQRHFISSQYYPHPFPKINYFRHSLSDGGIINFQVKIKEEETKNDRVLVIEVKDNGIGIKKDQMEKIFDRFYQIGNLKAKNKDSTGLGLSLTKELVELHGGTIQVQSKAGQGATFKVELPLQTTQELPSSFQRLTAGKCKQNPSYATADSPPKHYDPIWEDVAFAPMSGLIEGEKPILLIVEDNLELSSFIAFHFNEDYQVFEVQDGSLGFQKAVEIIPDVVVTDVMMPVMDGIELCQKLKADERTSHIPVILLSAKA